ncbi:hypothetical protein QTN25_002232 [Entamoeba marina]
MMFQYPVGKLLNVNDKQLAKQQSPNKVNKEGKLIDCNDLQTIKQPSPNSSTVDGNIIDFNNEQPSKPLLLINSKKDDKKN